MGIAAKVLILVLATVCATGVGIIAVAATDVARLEASLLPATVATGLCLAPAFGTFVLADFVTRKTPDFGPLAVLVGTGVRVVVAVAGVFFLGDVLGRFGVPRERFAEWVAYLYVVTLATECGLLIATVRQIGKANTGAAP